MPVGGVVLVSFMSAHDMNTGFTERIRWSREHDVPVWPDGPLRAVLLLYTYIFLINGVFGSRALCRYGCFFSPVFRPLQRFSLWRIRKVAACVECGDCSRACIMGIDVMHQIQRAGQVGDLDCVRCLTCIQACTAGSLGYRARAPKFPVPERPASAAFPLLPVRVELVLLGVALLGFSAGIPGAIWGSSFLLSLGGIGLAVVSRVRAYFSR